MSWVCYLCAKQNDEAERDACACCKRPRDYAPKSYIDRAKAQPLALHGIASGQFAFRPEQLEALVRGGLDLDAQDTLGWTALHCAAQVGEARVVAAILERDSSKALLEAATRPGGWRALHYAVAAGHLAVVEELLAADADVDARADEPEGPTPLHLAAQRGHGHVVDLLLDCGANPNFTASALRRTALHFAVASRSLKCARVLLARTNLASVSDAEGMSPLQQAHLLRREPASPDSSSEQLVLLLEVHENPHDRLPLLSAFLRDAIG
ncbi:hypothetical protein PybrP1_010501 [[Pythium] brassicae (nom. inval.)]|nr:hypothetical protein PybrP1_010501 [[Pythium] brassicae (nom. inval.)]